MAEPKQNLFNEFKLPDPAEWTAMASTELGGKDPQQTLAWEVADLQGYAYYDKIHTPKTLSLPLRHSAAWRNIPLITVTNEVESNKTALTHLNEGADGILFYIPHDRKVLLNSLLEKIEWPHCNISFLTNTPAVDLSDELKKIVSKANYKHEELTGSLFAKTYPHHPQSINNIIHNLVSLTNFHCLGIYISSGPPANRLATGLVQAVQLVELLATSGISQKVALQHICFAIETGIDFFNEIATLRALRLLWFQVVRAYGIADYQPADLYVQAISTAWVQPAFEPHSNMLKSTTAAMAATTGGCNALTVLPEKESDARMVRIARNVSSLLKEESRFDKVADPLSGSFYLESLTNQIIRKAWVSFQHNMAGK